MTASLTEKIEGVAGSRSGLAGGFEDLNGKKSRRSALQADMKNANLQIKETNKEIEGIENQLLSFAGLAFDVARLSEVEAALADLAPRVLEWQSLAGRKEDCPEGSRKGRLW